MKSHKVIAIIGIAVITILVVGGLLIRPSTELPDLDVPIQAGLPESVVETYTALYQATLINDYDALADQLPRNGFSYSFGDTSQDPIGYWQGLSEEGVFAELRSILDQPYTSFSERNGETTYVWPAIFAADPADWGEEELMQLESMGLADELEFFQEFGGYIGYRTSITGNGEWIELIAGD